MTAPRAALILLGACSTSPGAAGPSNGHPSPPAAVSSDAALAGDHAMPQLIADLVSLLSNEIGFDDLTGRLGSVVHDPGVPMPAQLSPRDPAFHRVEVGRYPETGKPYTVELELSSPVSVASLVSAFGAYRQNRTDRGAPRELVFPPAGTGPWKVVVIAQLPPGASPVADGVAQTITLRRDPR